jgi:S-(hydroxymethyl)glutathione dehydrogenase/alcohol dehydrogenase
VNPFAGLGAFAERMVCIATRSSAVPKELPLDRAALLGCAVVTGVGSVVNGARVAPGSTVAVIGCGGIGLNLIQGAVLAGAGRIIAIDLQKKKLDLARIFRRDRRDRRIVGRRPGKSGAGADEGRRRLRVRGDRPDQDRRAGVRDDPPGPHGLPRRLCRRWALRSSFPGIAMLMLGKGLQGLFMGSSRFKQDIPMLATTVPARQAQARRADRGADHARPGERGYAKMRTGEQARSVIVFQS